MPAIDEPELKSNEPKPPIDVKGMSSKFTKAMKEGAVPPPSTPAEPPKAPEPPPAAPEPPVKAPEPKGTIPEPPKPKPPEPKPPEPPKPEPKPEKIPSNNFKELEASRDEFRKKYEAAEAKAKDIETKLANAIDPNTVRELEGKLEKATKQAEEAREFVDRFYLEHSPSFRKAYSEKIESILEDTKEALGAEVGEKIVAVLQRANSKGADEELEALTDELSKFKQNVVTNAFTELKRLHRERDGELKNSKENVKKLQEYEQQQAQARSAEFAKSIKSTFNSELGAFEGGVDGFKSIEGKDDYNRIVAENRERAEAFIASDLQQPTNRVRMALWASYGIHANRLVAAQNEKIVKLEKQISDMQGANPSLRPSASTKLDGDTKTEGKPGDRIVSRWREAQEKGIPPKE